MKTLSDRIEQLRGERTQKDFAHLLNVPLNTYTNWTRGISQPNSEWVVHICTKLNVSADWLLGLSGDADAQAQRVQTGRQAAPSRAAEPQSEAYWRDLVASQQATIASLAGLLAAGQRPVAAPVRTGGRVATKSA